MSERHVTFQQYLEHERTEGKTEFRVVLQPGVDGLKSKIFVHPLGKDGDSRDFSVFENAMADVTKWLPGA